MLIQIEKALEDVSNLILALELGLTDTITSNLREVLELLKLDSFILHRREDQLALLSKVLECFKESTIPKYPTVYLSIIEKIDAISPYYDKDDPEYVKLGQSFTKYRLPCLINLGNTAYQQKNLNEALLHYLKCIQLFEHALYKSSSLTLQRAGIIYARLAKINFELKGKEENTVHFAEAAKQWLEKAKAESQKQLNTIEKSEQLIVDFIKKTSSTHEEARPTPPLPSQTPTQASTYGHLMQQSMVDLTKNPNEDALTLADKQPAIASEANPATKRQLETQESLDAPEQKKLKLIQDVLALQVQVRELESKQTPKN